MFYLHCCSNLCCLLDDDDDVETGFINSKTNPILDHYLHGPLSAVLTVYMYCTWPEFFSKKSLLFMRFARVRFRSDLIHYCE